MDLTSIVSGLSNAATETNRSNLKPTMQTNAIEISKDFRNFLHTHMEQLNQNSQAVDQQVERFIRMGDVEPHDIMLASQQAMLGLELTVQVRNKAVEAYQEIMRMQL